MLCSLEFQGDGFNSFERTTETCLCGMHSRHTVLWFPLSVPVMYVQGTEIVKLQVYENDFITADFYKRQECGISTSANGFCGCNAMAIYNNAMALIMWQLNLNSTNLVLVECH